MGNSSEKETCTFPRRRPERNRLVSIAAVAVLAGALASCSQPASDPAASPSGDPAANSSPAPGSGTETGSQAPDAGSLMDPLEGNRPAPTGTETVVISEQGTGTGSYPLPAVPSPGEKVMVTASCPEGERIIIESDAGLLWADLVCGNPAVSSYISKAATAGTTDNEIRVSTAEGQPYWLLVTVQEPAS